jgi:hypothetical protein
MNGVAARTVAGCFALASFSIALLAGIATGNAADTVLVRALLAMTFCYPVGLAIGMVAQVVINDHIDRHRFDNPAPDSTTYEDVMRSSAGAAEVGGERASEDVLVV